MLSHIVLEVRPNLWKIEASSPDVVVDACYLDRQTTLGGPNIDDGRVVAPGKFRGDGRGGEQAPACHPSDKCIQRGRIGVKRREVVRFAQAVLRLTGLQGRSQSTPALIHALVQVSEVSADVGWFARIEIMVHLRCITVTASAISFEQA